MVEWIDIDTIKPADYNPRKITPEQQMQLKESISKFGIVVPVLVNMANNTIIAGHQRTTVARMLGIKNVPVRYVNDIRLGDEIKFNQIHNMTEAEEFKVRYVKNAEKNKFLEFDHNDFICDATNATYIKEICKLMLKYGNVLSAVICKGKVILGGDYVKACKCLNYSVNGYICDENLYDELNYYFNQDYGKFCYEKVSRNTFVQGLAQLSRSVEKKEGLRQNKSSLYTTMVLPYMTENQDIKSILDFGCGKGAYITALKKKYNAVGVEFYNNNRKQIDVAKGNRQIDELINHLKKEPQFDVVVLDSVLNSTDSMEAEMSILACLHLFAKDVVFVSGRTFDVVEKEKK